MLLSNSCSAPNGQSQPQNGPRPQNSSPAAIEAQRRKIRGAERKYSQLNPVNNELAKVRTLTTESCAFAYHPNQTRTNSRKPRRTHVYTVGRRTRKFWKKKMRVRAPNAMIVVATLTVSARHIRIHSGSSSVVGTPASGAATGADLAAGAAAAAGRTGASRLR